MKKINFKQPKYIIPTIAYFGLLLLGYLFIDLFDTQVTEKGDASLQTTEYLNSDLPTANVSNDIGSKRKNVRDMFGDITDRSAIQDFVEDVDTTTKKKEDFESKYSEEELKRIQELEERNAEIKRLQELNNELMKSAGRATQMGSNDYTIPMTDEERQKALEMRRKGMMSELDRDLNNTRSQGVPSNRSLTDVQDSVVVNGKVLVKDNPVPKNAVRELEANSEDNIVVKKAKEDSEYFNTLSKNESNNNLIKAIVDEDIKVVEGSRIRLRLLDAIDINGTVLNKGCYLYAVLSGFSQQRVKGKISSVLVGDQILKISLSIYDTTDGLEGFYVPESSFRETAKEIGSSATQGNMNLSQTSGGSSVSQWAGQAVQNAYQRTSNAISKAIKKNKVRVKYGTQVFLVNSKSEKKR